MVHMEPRSSRGFPHSEHLRLCRTVVQATSRSLRHNQKENIRNIEHGGARYKNDKRLQHGGHACDHSSYLATVTAKVRQDKTRNAVQGLD